MSGLGFNQRGIGRSSNPFHFIGVEATDKFFIVTADSQAMHSTLGQSGLEELVGKKVRFEVLLDWDLKLPEGTFSKLVRGNTEQVSFLIDIDSPITFEPHSEGIFALSRRPTVKTSRLIVVFRQPDAIMEELDGGSTSEFTAPLLYGLRQGAALPSGHVKANEECEVIGPVSVHLVR